MASQFHSDRGLDDFDAATDLPIFLNLVLEKSESICQSRADQTIVEEHVAGKNFFWDHFLGSLETKLRIVTKPSHLVSNPF